MRWYYSYSEKSFDLSAAYKIDLSSLINDIDQGSYAFKNNILKIKESGIYELSGYLKGSVEVSDSTDEIVLALNNVEIETLETQACAPLVFSKPKNSTISKRYVHLVENSINKLCDSEGDNATDGDGAAIQAKKRDLVINGKGQLLLEGKGEETSGIKAKTDLIIRDSTVNILSVNKSGIKADEKVAILNANIKIDSKGDGIKTDLEPSTEEEALNYSSSLSNGYLYIENTSIDIVSGDDGICSNNGLFIKNNENNLIKILSNKGVPNTISESTSNSANGKGIKVAGIKTVDTYYKSSFENEYGLVITGGNFVINSNDDAISSKGNLIISGGAFVIDSGDDGIHSEYLTKIKDGDIKINKCYEGIEGAFVEIYDGEIDLISADDGINAANGDLRYESFYIHIAGGNIHVDAEGDGLDSNGTIQINGGCLLIDGPTREDNGALDSDKGIIVNGGTICAIGSKGMVETPSQSSNQNYINIGLENIVSSGSQILLKDKDGTTIFSHTSKKSFQSVVLSMSNLILGEKFTIIAGNESFTFTISSKATILGNTSSSHPGRSGPR